MERLTLKIFEDGTLELEGERHTLESLEERLERDQADGVSTLIVGNASEDTDWTVMNEPLKLLQRFNRAPIGIVGSRQS